MKTITILLLTFTVIGCSSTSFLQKEEPDISHSFYNDGKIKTERLSYLKSSRSIFKSFYPNGNIKSVKLYQNGVLDGISREYYEGGTLRRAVEYKNNLMDGFFNQYYQDGQLWIHAEYRSGELISQHTYDERGYVVGQNKKTSEEEQLMVQE